MSVTEEDYPYGCTMKQSKTNEQNSWKPVDAMTLQVRGKNYIKDKKKYPSGPCIFISFISIAIMTPCGVDIVEGHEVANYSSKSYSTPQKAKAAGSTDFFLVMNLMLPGDGNKAVVLYFIVPPNFQEIDPVMYSLWQHILNDPDTDNTFRNERIKLIPHVIDGPWVVKKAVGQKPALVGNKLKQTYYKGDNYYEVDLDVSSDKVASFATKTALSHAKSLIIDLAWTLEGRAEEELPERVLCGVTFAFPDPTSPKKVP